MDYLLPSWFWDAIFVRWRHLGVDYGMFLWDTTLLVRQLHNFASQPILYLFLRFLFYWYFMFAHFSGLGFVLFELFLVQNRRRTLLSLQKPRSNLLLQIFQSDTGKEVLPICDNWVRCDLFAAFLVWEQNEIGQSDELLPNMMEYVQSGSRGGTKAEFICRDMIDQQN